MLPKCFKTSKSSAKMTSPWSLSALLDIVLGLLKTKQTKNEYLCVIKFYSMTLFFLLIRNTLYKVEASREKLYVCIFVLCTLKSFILDSLIHDGQLSWLFICKIYRKLMMVKETGKEKGHLNKSIFLYCTMSVCLASPTDLEPFKGHTFVFILPSKWQCEDIAELKIFLSYRVLTLSTRHITVTSFNPYKRGIVLLLQEIFSNVGTGGERG